MSAAAAYWPDIRAAWKAGGRLHRVPDLLTRGRADAVGGAYQQMADRRRAESVGLGRGNGRSRPFFNFLAAKLAGCRIAACGLDRYQAVRSPHRYRGGGSE